MNKILQIIKQLRDYHSFCRYCGWAGGADKIDWIVENRIEPLKKEHPFLCWIGGII